jgi:hypothetical protein
VSFFQPVNAYFMRRMARWRHRGDRIQPASTRIALLKERQEDSMKHVIRRSLVTITTAGALTLLGGLATTSANAATTSANAATTSANAATASAHVTAAPSQSPRSLGFCLTHWQDNNGNDLPYATFTCLVTGDTVWQGFAQCTDDTVYFTREHTGAGNDQINCPPGYVVINAGVNFLN